MKDKNRRLREKVKKLQARCENYLYAIAHYGGERITAECEEALEAYRQGACGSLPELIKELESVDQSA